MYTRLFFPVILAALASAQESGIDEVLETDGDLDNKVCGQGQENQLFATQDTMLVCLFFESTVESTVESTEADEINLPQKVVYSTKVDNFESLQVAGLYDLFKDHIKGELTVTAMANGI